MTAMQQPPVVLVLRALGLGDFFTGLPALTLLRRALPSHHIVLALPRPFWPLARLSGLADDMVHGHELDPLVAPPQRPQLAVDLHGNGPASRELLEVTAPERVLAFAGDGPQWSADEHEVHRWCRLIADGLPAPGARFPGVAGALPVLPDEAVPEGVTVVHCGAKALSRRWPPDRFAAVADRLRAGGHDVLVVGGAAERELTESIGRAAGVPVATSFSLPQLVALVGRARLLISGDTGPSHVASNYRTPSVTLFGPVSPAVWGPPADERHQVLWHGDGSGDPHGAASDPALLAITVDEVLAAADRAVSGLATAVRPGR
jgi:ADP-heptose:LPS heptosyltransferase